VILQLVKSKAQNGQLPPANFVKVENTSNQQQTQPNSAQEKGNKGIEINSGIKQKAAENFQSQQKNLSDQMTVNFINQEKSDEKSGEPLDKEVLVDRAVKQQDQKPQELQKKVFELPTAKKEFVKVSENENKDQSFVQKNLSQSTQAESKKVGVSAAETTQSQQKTVGQTVTDRSFKAAEQIKAPKTIQSEKNTSAAFQKVEQEKIVDQNSKTDVISKSLLNTVKTTDQKTTQSSSSTQSFPVKEAKTVQEKSSQNNQMSAVQEKASWNNSVNVERSKVQQIAFAKEDTRKTEPVNGVKNTAQSSKMPESSAQKIVQENFVKAGPQVVNPETSERTDTPKAVNIEQYQGEIKKLDFKKALNTISDKEIATQSTAKNTTNVQKIIDTPLQGQQRLVLSREIVEYLISQPQNASQVIQSTKEKASSVVKQSGILAQNIVSNRPSYERSVEQPQQSGLTFKQAQVVVRNAILQVQDSTNEFSQFKQIKREIPDQLKTSQPIKIENFKLEIARDLKKETPQIFEQPRNEKLEQTEHLRELLNSKSARKTYESEHQQTTQTQQEFRKDIDSIVVRVEQQERASNLQTIVDTIRQMHNTTTEKAVVDLSPPNLGKLEIELVKQQERLVITFKVVTDEAKEMLEKSSKDLISRLNTMGFKVEQVEVKTLPKTEEDYLSRDQQEQEQNQEKRHKKQQEEVKEDDQRD